MQKVSIIVATGNQGKMKEISHILTDLPIELTSLKDHFDPIPDIPETGSTFKENALLKAKWLSDKTNHWVLADDSGLEVDALFGEPGVHSARYAGEHGNSKANNEKLLNALKDIKQDQRTARFKCCMVLYCNSDQIYTGEGTCEGRIIESPIGFNGFGYDPLFIPDGYSETFAQLDGTIKNQISHRRKALEEIRKVIQRLVHAK